ncbi:MAG: rhodanese-like domain-containing protein [Verrucomicrobia bacterium]|nr:rhodanese-like domain-containing protein [Verrucomicrobiota bacterium]
MLQKILALCLIHFSFSVAGEKDTIPPSRGALPTGVREISIDEAEKLIRERNDIAVIDVRTAPEFFELGHLPRAQMVDYFREDFIAALGTLKLDPAKPCIVYCAIGGRARRVAEKMAKLGYNEIFLPKGSFKAWKDAGKPIVGAAKK